MNELRSHIESKAADLCWTHYSTADKCEWNAPRWVNKIIPVINVWLFLKTAILNNVSAVLTHWDEAGDSNQKRRAFSNDFHLSGKLASEMYFRIIKDFLQLNVATHRYNISHITPLKWNMRTNNLNCYFLTNSGQRVVNVFRWKVAKASLKSP